MNKKKLVKTILTCIFISFISEIIIFNFRSMQSLFYQKTVYNNIKISAGIEKEKHTYRIIDGNNCYIEIDKINKEVKNLKLDLTISNANKYLIYNTFVSDEGNDVYYELPERYYYPNIKKSKYLILDLSGKAKKIKIKLNGQNTNNFEFKINEIAINNKIPISISWTRLILITLSLLMLYCVRPQSKLYKYKVDFNNIKQKLIIFMVMIIEAFCFYYLLTSNKVDLTPYSNHSQYQQLTKSITNHKTYLDITPSKEIKEMKNPYDYGYRKKLTKEKNAAFEWDRAYYKGKYYVYFGIVPVLVSYLPVYLITNILLPNSIVIYIVSLLMILGLFLLEKEFVKRYFKNVSFLLFLLIYVWSINCTGLVGILCYPTLYNVPITFALMFTYFGLYFWISSIRDANISKTKIFLGSLCMALVAGCRPQLLVGSFLAFPIFWNKIFKERKLFSKKSIVETLLAIFPFIIVAIFLMYYNKIRFGSIFDFGANYNITGNDMTRRGFKIDRIGLGIFSYLLQPVNIKATFPFLTRTIFTTNYMGTTISEPMFGGLLVANPVLLFGIISPRLKKIIKNKKLFKINIFCLIAGLLLVILDTQMAGILQRYMSDFCWLFSIPTVITILSIFDSNINKKTKKILLEILLILISLAILHQFLYMFDDQLLHDMVNSSTEFYFKWYYLLQWWL